MPVSVKELRYKTREVIRSVERGEKPVITYRGKPVARIIPLSSRSAKKHFVDCGFGMWKDHPQMKNIDQWLNEQRKSRFDR